MVYNWQGCLMKKMMCLLISATIGLSLFSCSEKENDVKDNNSNLVGSLWVGNYHQKKLEGCALRFTSETTVWVIDWEYEYPGEECDSVLCTYTFSAPQGTINSEDYSDFIVDGNIMQLSDRDHPDRRYTLTRR